MSITDIYRLDAIREDDQFEDDVSPSVRATAAEWAGMRERGTAPHGREDKNL